MAKKKESKSKVEKKKEKKLYKYKAGRFCPKCGEGVKLAEHKDRYSCGKCGYYEKK